MSNYSDYYESIDDIIKHIRMDFIGPVKDDEILENEDPLSRYSVGILHAQKPNLSHKSIDIETLFNQEMFENSDAEEFINTDIYNPSSIAISTSVLCKDVLNISFSFAVYRQDKRNSLDNDEEKTTKLYIREQREISKSVSVPNKICNISLNTEIPSIGLHLHLRRINKDGTKLITVSAVNKNISDNSFADNNEKALFQCKLTINSQNGFQPIYVNNYRKSLEKDKNNMLYDSIKNYSYGHGCSSSQIESNNKVCTIMSDFIPSYRMVQMMPRLFSDADYLYMKYWKSIDRETGCKSLYSLISQYSQWLEKLKNNTQTVSNYPLPAKQAFNNIEICVARLKRGVDTLLKNDIAWNSFRFMNQAMLLQRVKTKKCNPEIVSWYPFQMAYILQIIPDIVDNNSDFRKDVDLLWFPTGGGKTEAYLGLSAFTIFYRRLSAKSDLESNGVTVIMRYTLRLLTIQQFERATALICACEHIRKANSIPGEEISIGLWIGSAMTPNHIKDASDTLEKIKEDSTANIFEANPMQIVKCPWCNSEINVNGYNVINGAMNISCCENRNCEFHNHLPIYVVDDDIYNKMPTFLLSTVDKFARLAWEEKAGNLFGANGNNPPELLIQDELHLISGPLGSICGLYEIAVDEICKHYGASPKIIASTATVKNADKQIKILYNRNMVQFPPNGLSYKDSYFAIEATKENKPARTYLGICPTGGGSSETLIKVFALLTYMKHLFIKQGKPLKVIDQFYTTVGYFNTLKELGSTANIISDRILSELKYIISHKFKSESQKFGLQLSDIPSYFKNDELTSRNSAKEIRNILDRLNNKFNDDSCFDYILASNMLSVGIDIDRLGVMSVYGQPKSNAEYIQATSRVGRTNPGLVISLYNGMRSRDKSYYEQFNYYHSTFYKYVESTSVTSYSPRAIEKALHCAFIAIIRQTIKKYNPNEGASLFIENDKNIIKVKNEIVSRVKEIEPRIAEFADEWLDYYLECWKKEKEKVPDRLVFYDYQNEDIALFKSADNSNGSDIPTILNSVRNVEMSSDVYFTKR